MTTPFSEAGPRQCRFIPAKDLTVPVLCCGAETPSVEEPYCAEHRAICYRPRETLEGNASAPKPQRAGTFALLPTVPPMRRSA